MVKKRLCQLGYDNNSLVVALATFCSNHRKLVGDGYKEDYITKGLLSVLFSSDDAWKDKASGKSKTIDDAGLNFIANLERNLSTINYNNGIITGIPQKENDVGYGHDISVNPLSYTPSNPLSASDALKLLIDDTTKITDKFDEDINVSFTQQQLNGLVAIKYNCGALSQFDGLLPMLERGNYNRNEFANIINNYYIGLATNNPGKYAHYLDGWLNRTEKMMDVFFNGDYGYMPIDAVNGKVAR